MFAGCINPLASMLCNFLAMQVGKGFISKDEAKYLIASSVDVINTADLDEHIRHMGADMLMRMIKAIDGITFSQ